MILKQGHKYEPMPHDGKLIAYIYRGGRCYYKDSPYSLAATQALKAAFPQYWTAIRNYGYAHPQLVPFINEDPMLIVSLVEVGKTRWMVGSGAAYITTDIIPTQGSYARTLCKVISAEEYPWTDIFGCRNGANNKAYFVSINVSTQVINIAINTKLFNPSLSFAFGEEIDIVLDTANSKAYANGVEVAIAKVETPSYPMKLFTQNNAGNQAARNTRAIAVMEYKDATQNAHFIPMQRTDGTCGMLDIVSLTFHPNANTQGAFTIEITDKE